MPKHQANLDFQIATNKISSQYDLDGQLCAYVEISHRGSPWLPINMSASNYCVFRGMLFKSDIHFKGKAWVAWTSRAQARFVIGDHPRVHFLKLLGIADKPLMAAYIPNVVGTLDDHVESWYLTAAEPPIQTPEGMKSVVDLPLSEDWLPPPAAPVPEKD